MPEQPPLIPDDPENDHEPDPPVPEELPPPPPVTPPRQKPETAVENPLEPSMVGQELGEEPLRKRPKIGLKLLFQQLKFILSLIFENLRDLFLMVINIKDTTDVDRTVSTIKTGIRIKGYNIWILIASSVLACIGLDTNSAAVIIGAMLISPLMSPILGIGLSVGINDRKTLQDALYNFGIAVGVSLLAAFVYFLVTPLGRETPEMSARTTPTVLDIMVGFFGGVAGIVAGSRKEATNAIPGVAIATALMPPLCVAGFGLAKMNMSYFAGAFYLFFLNSVFIALSTFLIVRYLNFPVVEKITSSLRKNFVRGVAFFVIISMVPAVWLFIDVIRKSNWDSKIQVFLTDKFPEEDFSVEEYKYIIKDSVRTLKLTVAGTQYIPEDTIAKWQKELLTHYYLKKTELRLIQTKSDPNDYERLTQNINDQINARLTKYDADRERAFALQQEVQKLRDELFFLKEGELPLQELRRSLLPFHEELAAVQFGEIRATNLQDTVARRDAAKDGRVLVLMFSWRDTLIAGIKEDREKLIRTNLRENFNRNNVQFIDLNTPYILPEDTLKQQPNPEE